MIKRFLFLMLVTLGASAVLAQEDPVQIVKNKLTSVVLPDIDFQNVTLQDGIGKLWELSIAADPGMKDIIFVIKAGPEGIAHIRPFSLSMKAPTLGEAVEAVGVRTGCKVVPERWAIALYLDSK